MIEVEVGRTYSIEDLIIICDLYSRIECIRRLTFHPPKNPFIFDGCSGPAPDKMGDADLSIACFLHDIAYYCGFLKDDEHERAISDYQFASDLLLYCNAPVAVVDAFVTGVRVFGDKWPSVRWGWGRI